MGINCVCIRRTNRQGYKAGALKEGLDLLRDYDHVAIFDADFKPESDFMVLFSLTAVRLPRIWLMLSHFSCINVCV